MTMSLYALDSQLLGIKILKPHIK